MSGRSDRRFRDRRAGLGRSGAALLACVLALTTPLAADERAREWRLDRDWLTGSNWGDEAPTGLRSDGLAGPAAGSPAEQMLSAELDDRFSPWPRLGPWLPWLPPLLVPDFSHRDPDDPDRHVGLGEPLLGTSWRNRPWHVGWLFGGTSGGPLINDRVEQQSDLFGGYRLGHDFDHYWGWEARLAFARPSLTDTQPEPVPRSSRDLFLDFSLVHYPWGDARWRPYLAGGVGWAYIQFSDDRGQPIENDTVVFPIGVGLKYYCRKWLAVRFDVRDNIVLSAPQLDTRHSVTGSVGVEIRLGPRNQRYSPW